MSEYYDNRNRGVAFPNDRRQNDRSPTHKGSCETVCQHCGKSTEFWLSGWIKRASANARNAGQKFFSFALTPKEDNEDYTGPSKDKVNPADEFDDDIPF